MKKLVSVMLASLLLLSVASPTFAAGGPRGENHCNRATPGGIQCGGHGNHGN